MFIFVKYQIETYCLSKQCSLRILFCYIGRKGCQTVKPIYMKRFLKAFLCFAILASGTALVEAQGLGGLIKKGKENIDKGKRAVKKGKESLEKALGKDGESTETPSSVDSTNVNPEQGIITLTNPSGIIISNPVSSFIEIVPIGLYGVSKSENFGDAYLVLKVRKLIPQEQTGFGSEVKNQKMIAVDNNGKV